MVIKEVKEFEFPGMTIRWHTPQITAEERARRMKQIHNQANKLLRKVDAK